MSKTKEQIYYVSGMHCASCELIIEKKLLELKEVKSVEASTTKGQVLVEYEGIKPKTEELNKIFKKENYLFSEEQIQIKERFPSKEFFSSLVIALLIIVGFVVLNKSGLIGLVNVNSKSSLVMFFLFGILAGLSTCAALVGGLILSMSKQWSKHKFQPHLMFNAGRIIAYMIFGAILGIIGSKLQISLTFTSFLVMAVSLIMIFMALEMLGLKALRKFQITMPKFITRYVADEKNFHGRYMPFLLGALTFFLPCGFTLTAQGLALLSGNPIQGGLIMLFFVLGTMPTLLIIGLSSFKFSQRPHFANKFLKIAGILVLFFALYNLNSQLSVLGFKNLGDIKLGFAKSTKVVGEEGFAPIVNGKQILKMDASSTGYSPNYFKVKAGIPVRWEIIDKGTSGCTNAVISRNLFDGQIDLIPGKVSVKEFTPNKAGKYKFSCWMGMISGVIEVVDVDKENNNKDVNININKSVVPSGASGCGCGEETICGSGGCCGI